MLLVRPQGVARGQYLGPCIVNTFGLILLRYTVYVGILGQIEQPHQCSSSKASMHTLALDLYSWLVSLHYTLLTLFNKYALYRVNGYLIYIFSKPRLQ